MIDKSVRDGPWPTKIETVQFSHRAKVNRNKPVGRDRQDSRRRELEDPAVDHTGARAQVGMDARTERRRVWSGVGGLHTDRQTLFRQRVRDQQPEPVRIADLSMHCQPSATVWGFPADHLKVLPTARTRPPPGSSTQFRNVSGFGSNITPTGRRFAWTHCSSSRSLYVRAARSRNSWSYFVGADMAESSCVGSAPSGISRAIQAHPRKPPQSAVAYWGANSLNASWPARREPSASMKCSHSGRPTGPHSSRCRSATRLW